MNKTKGTVTKVDIVVTDAWRKKPALAAAR
jgi:hypothetical protein